MSGVYHLRLFYDNSVYPSRELPIVMSYLFYLNYMK